MTHKIFKIKFLVLIAFLILGCDSKDDEDCMKTIVVPQAYFINGQSYSYDTTLEVPCDFPEPEGIEEIDPPLLEGFSYEVLNFNFVPDTGNNTAILEFEIKLNNPNNYSVSGIPYLTLISDGNEFSTSYSSDASIPCYDIDANSSCTLTYYNEYSLNLGIVNSVELISVAYYLTN